MENIKHRIESELIKSKVFYNESMAGHTSFHIGGKADIFIDVDISELSIIYSIAEDMSLPVTVIGNGSNLLVGDKGIRGITLCIGDLASGMEWEDTTVKAYGGELITKLSKCAAKKSLSGLEFASGIPGSVGGGVIMNAGAYDGELSNHINYVSYFDVATKDFKTIEKKDCNFSYRNSIFQDIDAIVTCAVFELIPSDKSIIYEKMEDFNERRREKQPLEYPSAGSTFKRPEGMFAGKLISDAGLMGFSVGGAKVSTKHAGFIINDNNATAYDVCELIKRVKEVVFDKYHVLLETEVKFIGDFDVDK